MTERLYYDEPYLLDFQATVTGVTTVEGGGWKVVLDRSAFYPESGGQPADHGSLEAEVGTAGGRTTWKVVDVREDGVAVGHVVEAPGTSPDHPPLAAGQQVHGHVDRARRLDHMQQHAGQHVLSAAMVNVAGANTIGFHLSDQSVTIDLDVPALDAAVLEKVEQEANRVVFADLPVTCGWYMPEEAARLPLRKPAGDYAKVRVVEVQGFDWSACGGTHPRRTGEIGLIKILGVERIRGSVRVAFACGERARREFELRLQVTRAAGATLAVPVPDIPDALEKLSHSARETGKELERARKELLLHEAEALWMEAAAAGGLGSETAAAARPVPGPVIVTKILAGRDPSEARALATAITVNHSDTYALFGLESGGQAQVFFARSKDMPNGSGATPDFPDARTLISQVLPLLGGRGGGTPFLAQGGGSASGSLPEALSRAIALITGGR